MLVGDWAMVGTHPAFPSVAYGHCSFEWLKEGALLVWRFEWDRPGPPSALSVVGHDDADAVDVCSKRFSAGQRDGHADDPERANGDDDRQDGRHDRLYDRMGPTRQRARPVQGSRESPALYHALSHLLPGPLSTSPRDRPRDAQQGHVDG